MEAEPIIKYTFPVPTDTLNTRKYLKATPTTMYLMLLNMSHLIRLQLLFI